MDGTVRVGGTVGVTAGVVRIYLVEHPGEPEIGELADIVHVDEAVPGSNVHVDIPGE